MSTTEPPGYPSAPTGYAAQPQEAQASPPNYPITAGPVGHRLNARVIALIVAAVVIVAGGVTAAILLTTRPSPAPPSDTGPFLVPSTSSQPAPTTTSRPPLTTTATPSITRSPAPQTSATPAGAIPIADGISITLAPGWTVDTQDGGSILIFNADGSAGMLVMVGKADSTDIKQVLSDNIQQETNTGVLTNVQLGEFTDVQPLQSPRFQQMLLVKYTAVMSMQQGTIQQYGIFGELLNPSTRETAFIDLFGISVDDVKAATQDADAMVASML